MSRYVFVFQALNPDILLRVGERHAKMMTRDPLWSRVTPVAVRKACWSIMENTSMSIKDIHALLSEESLRIRPMEPIDYQHAWQFLSESATRGEPRSVINNLDVVISVMARLSGSTYVSIIRGKPVERVTHMYSVTLLQPKVGFRTVYVLADTVAEAAGYASRRLVEASPPSVEDVEMWFGEDPGSAQSQCYGVWDVELVQQPDTAQLAQAERAWQL